MKYLISWTARLGRGVEDAKQAMSVFSKWQPSASATFHQFVQRVDGNGGYAIVETENGAALLRDALTFGTWFDFTATPVVDMLEATAVQQEVIDLLESIPTS
jgi:hypothetical protein